MRWGTASLPWARPPSFMPHPGERGWACGTLLGAMWGGESTAQRKEALPCLSPRRDPSRKWGLSATRGLAPVPKTTLSCGGQSCGSWKALGPISTAQSRCMDTGYLGLSSWGVEGRVGSPRGSPLRACTKGFPLEQPVFNDYKGTGV